MRAAPGRLLRMLAAGLAMTGCGGVGPAPAPTPESATALVVEAGDLDALRFLRPVADKAKEMGAGSLRPIGAAVLATGDQLGGFISLGADQCVVALAQPGPSIEDVDLFIFSDGGELLASDEAPEATASAMVCPPHPRRLYVAARVMSGNGMLGVGVLPVPATAGPSVAEALGVRGRPGADTGRLAAWPGLERIVRERRERLGSTWTDQRRLTLPLDPRVASAVTVTIDADRCVDVIASPGAEVASIQLTAVDMEGRVVARAKGPGKDRALLLCSRDKEVVTVFVRPRASSGVAAVVIGSSIVGAARELRSQSWVDASTALWPLDEGVRRRDKELEQAAVGPVVTLPGALTAAAGAATVVPVLLEPGCTRLDVIAGAPLGAFVAELWGEGDRRISRARGRDAAALFACGPGGKATLEVRALSRPGPFVVQLRRDAKPPPLLLAHPVAAQRLLERIDMAGYLAVPAVTAAVRAVALASGRRQVVPLEVSAGRCVDVLAARGEGVGDLALRWSDDGGEVGRLHRAPEVLAERICAVDGARRGRLELQVSDGATTALLLTTEL